MLRSGLIACAALMLIAGGCATRGNVDLLENQLRQQEDQLFAARAELERAETDLRTAQQELQALRVQLAENGEKTLLPEQAQALYRVSGVRVNKLFSGGLDRDGVPGDDVLHVVLTPHDKHGETVKLPGMVEFEVIDLAAPESSRRLGSWQFSAEEVAEHWQSGLTSGFQFRVPLEHFPQSDDIVVQARFATVDGRQFGTIADVRITPPDTLLANSPKSQSPSPQRTAKPPLPTESGFFVEQADATESDGESSTRLELNGSETRDRKPSFDAPEDSKPETNDSPLEKTGEDFFPMPQATAPRAGVEKPSAGEMPADIFPADEPSASPTMQQPEAVSSDWGWQALDEPELKADPQTRKQAPELVDDFQALPVNPVPTAEKKDPRPARYQRTDRGPFPDAVPPSTGDRKPGF